MGYAQPGEMQPERDANFQGGEDVSVVRLDGRRGRKARSWFSFDLSVDPAQAMALVITYHSGERRRGPATFEILVDGTRVAEEKVDRSTPSAFFDLKYDVPQDLVRDKEKVTVRFQATNSNEIATVFGIRMIRVDREH